MKRRNLDGKTLTASDIVRGGFVKPEGEGESLVNVLDSKNRGTWQLRQVSFTMPSVLRVAPDGVLIAPIDSPWSRGRPATRCQI